MNYHYEEPKGTCLPRQCTEKKKRRSIGGFAEKGFGENQSLLHDGGNDTRALRKPAMTERFISMGERENISCAERTVKNFSPLTSHFSCECKRVAFTLAEVLITLSIIGVVAAITLPSVIQKHHQKQMEIQFKKAYSALQQALYSIDTDMYATLSSNAGNSNTEFFKDLYSKYRIANDKQVGSLYKKNNKFVIKTYTKQSGQYNLCAQLPSRIAADGSAIGGMYNCYANWIVIDTNGPKGKPNALGHDIFYFLLTDKGKLIPTGSTNYPHWEMRDNTRFCNKNSTEQRNGSSCAYFAVSNTCPDDNSKTYWECLP